MPGRIWRFSSWLQSLLPSSPYGTTLKKNLKGSLASEEVCLPVHWSSAFIEPSPFTVLQRCWYSSEVEGRMQWVGAIQALGVWPTLPVFLHRFYGERVLLVRLVRQYGPKDMLESFELLNSSRVPPAGLCLVPPLSFLRATKAYPSRVQYFGDLSVQSCARHPRASLPAAKGLLALSWPSVA